MAQPPPVNNLQNDRYKEFKTAKLEDHPKGYPRLAAYLSLDAEGKMYRRFGHLRARLLLYHQDVINNIERDIKSLDEAQQINDPRRVISREYDERDASDSERKILMQKLDCELKHYDELLLREHQLSRIPPPTKNAHKHYFDWIFNTEPVPRREYEFIYQTDDFVAVGIPEDPWIDSFFETFERVIPKSLLKMFLASPEDLQKSDDPGTHFYSDERSKILAKAIIGITATFLLLLPIIVFYLLLTNHVANGVGVGVLCAFVIVFNIVLLTSTKVSKQEIFGASAAYCAVLVVFLGNLPPSERR